MQTGKGILIPSILKVGNGTLKKIGQYLKAENLEQVVIFFGNGLIDLFGMDVMDSLKQEGITVLEYSELDTVDIDDIITLAFAMPNKTQAVISIGGGKVIDAGKYAAFCAIFHLSVFPLQVPVMDFPAQARLFWCMEKNFRSGKAGIWNYCGYAGHKDCTG